MRQEYQFPVEPEKWAAGLAERLEFLNKDYRRTVRTNTQTLGSRLRSLYEPRAIASLGKPTSSTQHSTGTQGSSLVLASKSSVAEPEVNQPEADLMCDLLARVDSALQLCTSLQDLVPQVCSSHASQRDCVVVDVRYIDDAPLRSSWRRRTLVAARPPPLERDEVATRFGRSVDI